MKILVGSTIPAFAMSSPDWSWWLSNRNEISARAEAEGHQVSWLAVLQEDARRLDPFRALIDIAGDAVDYHRFSLDLDVDEWDSGTRLTGICIGRNLIIDRAIRTGADWIYFADSDIEAPDDILVRLVELDWPVVGAHVPTYGLDGPSAQDWSNEHRPDRLGVSFGYLGIDPVSMAGDGHDVRVHWNTAGSLLVHRDVFRRVPWRHDPDAGNTDDPATQAEMERLGWPTLVRHDVVCHHHPESIGALERRGLDLAVYR